MEDDDLELLRMAALKSLQSKKTQNKEKVGNAIKVVESINSVPAAQAPYFASVNSTAGSRIQTLVNPNDNSTINETYLPQRRDAITPWVESEFVGPYGLTVPPSRSMIPNVQLSPRSAAFVSQNNDILNRRKVYAASPERDRSRSPITPPSRYNTPGRWSASPPPYKHVIARPHYEHRSGSRSPIHREKSPQIYRRSPLPNSKSPPQALRKSRSPPPLKIRKSPLRKSLSGSPLRAGTDRRPASPYTRNRSPGGRYPHNQKSYRRHSPSQPSRSYNRKQLARRSLSPRKNGHHPIKRSKSPVNSKRSRSRSPNRNVASRPSRNERVNKRRSPLYNRKSNSNRGSNRSKRKLTPPQSPTNKKKAEKSQNSVQPSTDDKKTSPTVERTKIEKTTDAAADKPEPASEKTTEKVEKEGSASSDDDQSSDENEDDGIDLFASEESESENEGRFKSNSSKNTRSNAVATVSFSKLGTSTTTTAMGDLNEVKSDKNSTSSHREDRYKRGSNYSSRKDDRSRKYGSSRNEDSRYGDSSRSSYKSRYMSSTASAVPKVVEEKKKDEKSMFKSTFQVLPNEMKSEAVKSTSKPIVSSRVSPIKEKSGEKKLIVLKRPAESTVDDPIDEETTDKIPSSSAGDNAKKSVHARLGAPTKTWKNKKSWRTEKFDDTPLANDSFNMHIMQFDQSESA